MTPHPLTMSANYLAVARGLRELHRLTEAGRLDSPEADVVRDATDTPWEAIGGVEKKRIGGLSEDLYSISGPLRTITKELNPQARDRLVEIDHSRKRGEWDRCLELLRRWGFYIDPYHLSYLRGAVWLEAGDPATAAIFFKHASDRQPGDGNTLAIYLITLNKSSPPEARALAVDLLRVPDEYPPVVVVHAASVVFEIAKELSGAEAEHQFRELIGVVGAALRHLQEGDEGGADESTSSMAYALLGFCHEFLGENQAALVAYSKGLAISPDNVALLIPRGILLYGDSPGAIEDFQLAVRDRPPVVWPYYFLAHHCLMTEQLDLCRLHCERGLEEAGSDATKSELAEWLAISQAELGFPDDLIRRTFGRSLRYDPSNERARRNLAMYEAAIRPIPMSDFETRTKHSVRASGLLESRSDRAAA